MSGQAQLPSEDIAYLSARDLIGKFGTGDLSPVEAATACLDRIAATQDSVNAFTYLDAETTLAQARESEARWRAGRPKGLLDGVPVAIKDLLLTKGWPTRRGSKVIAADQEWSEDAPAVARLKAHGAVLVGKTTTPEFGWKGVTDNPLDGITRNPWDLTKTPGGSSGGSSAALAAGLCPLAIGTDGGGSIRIPASFAGVVGLKPSYGRVPAWPLSPFGTVAHVGPMARTVADTALFLSVIAEPDARDWYSLPPGSRPDGGAYHAGLDEADRLKGKKVAYVPALGGAAVEPETAALIAAAAKHLEAAGAAVEEADPGIENPKWIFRALWWAGAGFALGDLPAEQLALLDPDLRAIVREGRQMPLKDYLSAVKAREELGTRMRVFMEEYDLLIAPTVAVPAFKTGVMAPPKPDGGDAVDADYWVNWTPFSYPFNLSQQPAISIPCGFTREGLPVGCQLVGRMFDDAEVLRAAKVLEARLHVPVKPDLDKNVMRFQETMA